MKSANLANPSRYFFLNRDDAEKVVDACPDAHWRLLFALARFGGMRVPSEPALLRWEDVHWAQERITVTSPKTEHHSGGDFRVIPLFPELRPFLEDCMELAEPGTEFVLPAHIRQHTNPGTMLRKVVKRAGLKPWPNLRSTREMELAEQFPAHVVCAWMGNTEDVAKLHYLQVTDDHFQKAVQNPVQSMLATTHQDSPDSEQQDEKTFERQAVVNCGAHWNNGSLEDRGNHFNRRKYW